MKTQPKPQSRNGSLDKAIRLVLIMRMQDQGKLIAMTNREIANLLPTKYKPSVMTIGRDLRAIEVIRKALVKMEGVEK